VASDPHNPAITWLLASDEPAIRYRTRTWLLDQPESHAAVRREQKAAWDGPIISTLLDFASAAKVHPYRKWWGLHWRLTSLAEFALPVQRGHVRATLDAGIDRELTWITNPRHIAAITKHDDGLYRADASIEGNALYAASRFGHAQDERARLLATNLLEWQWPDGGWNCNGGSSGYRSSFHESWATAIGLATYHDAVGKADSLGADARAAARRTAELLLEHRLFYGLKTGKPIHSSWIALHWPAYWHYDFLAGLRVLRDVDAKLLSDARAADALDLLESKQRPDGRFQPGGTWWQPPTTATSPVEAVDWGKGRPSEVLTLHALAILKAAGRQAGAITEKPPAAQAPRSAGRRN
jgi:hypothetical protein